VIGFGGRALKEKLADVTDDQRMRHGSIITSSIIATATAGGRHGCLRAVLLWLSVGRMVVSVMVRRGRRSAGDSRVSLLSGHVAQEFLSVV
jgi:hypothetical protein